MSKSEWQIKVADFMPLYEAGAYTASEFFWFVLPLFDGGEDDKELWGVLPKQVKERFLAEMNKGAISSDRADDPATAALMEKLAAVRRVAMQ